MRSRPLSLFWRLRQCIPVAAIIRYAHVAVYIVRVDSVTALFFSKLDPLCHDIADAITTNIDPFLIVPAIQGLAEDRLLELCGVWTIRFIRTTAEVADHLLAQVMEQTDGLVGVGEQIDVEDFNIGIRRLIVR